MRAKAIRGILAAVGLTLFLQTHAHAQQAKQGTYTGHFGNYAVGKIFELEKDHAFWVGEFSGTFFNDAGKGFLHLASVVCPGVNDIIKGGYDAQGRCIATDQDGDKAFLVWKCKGQDRCEGDFQWTGGTGKYTGLKGHNTFSGAVLPNTSSGAAFWKGEWQVP